MIGTLSRHARAQARENAILAVDDFLAAQRTRIRLHLTCAENRLKLLTDPGPYLGEKDCDQTETRA